MLAPSVSCPALLVAAPASGQGKTTLTAALARLASRRGLRVRVFKCGPDFLDPQWLALASGHPVHNVDLWMTGEPDVRQRLYAAAQQSDLILVEGVMGLFDGQPSAADLAQRWGLPVLAVMDASATSDTLAALAYGLRHYRPGLPWAGVLANRVGSARHGEMVAQSLGEGFLGAVLRDAGPPLPERHLGLLQAAELPDALSRLDAWADALEATPLGQFSAVDWQRYAVDFPAPESSGEPSDDAALRPLAGRRVAVARDAAFSFIYPANLETLTQLGATLAFFSPLADDPVPPADAVWLPGGYPELHAAALSAATRCAQSLRDHVDAGRPLWAECGGMMPLFDTLIDKAGQSHALWGLLPGAVMMQARLAALGPQQWSPDGRVAPLRGHTFHYSRCETALPPLDHAQAMRGGLASPGEAVYGRQRLRASYFHAWMPSSPEAVALLLGVQA
ncbi:cobyrinate a,c-diamide synthase [Amphibiibacter pelophylacis]|uniref:Cobyrinate a,c-diamide synthase n=1 Tax=Amphibiibacter pelophylacis TaxID=1799477 RepID=A0ACC6NZI0_9BURK